MTATSIAAGFLFLLSFQSPVEMVEADPALMLVAAQAVLDHQTLRLDGFREDPDFSYDLDTDYRAFRHGDSSYYFSPGAVLASVPVVATANALGLDMGHQDQEFILQNLVSALLVALVFVLLVRLGRDLVGPWTGLVIALVTTLGSPLVSTLATGLWNSGYQIVLICVALILVVRHEGGEQRRYLLWVASILAFAFVVRPSTAFLILAIGLFSRDIPVRWRLQGLVCGVVVVVFLFSLGFGDGVMRYYSPRKILPQTSLLAGLFGTMLSPSRGLLVYCPFVAVIVVASVSGMRKVLARPGARIAVAWITLHVLAVSTRSVWWGGHCFGPRLMADILPGFALLAYYSWRSLEASRRPRTAALFLVCGCLAAYINSYQGLFNLHTKRWNFDPNIDRNIAMIFDWRYPQFLASEEQLDRRNFEKQWASLASTEIDETLSIDGGRLALSGWYPNEGGWCWSRGPLAQIFLRLGSLSQGESHLLEMRAGALGRQVVTLEVNGRSLGAIELEGFEPQVRNILLPPEVLRPDSENRFTFHIPGATSTSTDSRILGLALRSLRVSRVSTNLPHITFKNDGSFMTGFSSAEAGWRWSDARWAAIELPVPKIEPETEYVLELEAGTLGRQSVDISLDGVSIGSIELSGHAPQSFALPVPAERFESFRTHQVQFEMPDAHRVADDDRLLGLAFVSLKLVRRAEDAGELVEPAVRPWE